MSIKAWILVVAVLVLLAVVQVWADAAPAGEYQVKAAFLYNFIMFVDWPDAKMAADNEPVIIGVIGKDPFGDAFGPIKDKQAKGRKVIVKQFKGLEELKKADKAEMDSQIEAIRKCHLLFICSSEKEKGTVKEIINLVKDCNVLVVGDTEGFLESKGGIINFILEDKKVRFEVDLGAARQANLQIRSQLLKLAKKVIGEELSQIAKK
jgi:hypothetical protein